MTKLETHREAKKNKLYETKQLTAYVAMVSGRGQMIRHELITDQKYRHNNSTHNDGKKIAMCLSSDVQRSTDNDLAKKIQLKRTTTKIGKK